MPLSNSNQNTDWSDSVSLRRSLSHQESSERRERTRARRFAVPPRARHHQTRRSKLLFQVLDSSMYAFSQRIDIWVTYLLKLCIYSTTIILLGKHIHLGVGLPSTPVYRVLLFLELILQWLFVLERVDQRLMVYPWAKHHLPWKWNFSDDQLTTTLYPPQDAW